MKLAPWTGGVLDALAEGAALPEIESRAASASDVTPERVRRFLQTLTKVGYLEVVVPLPTLPRYRVLRELGRGGVGVAFEALDETEARVVVKRPWGFLHPLAACEAALRREAETLNALDHPGVVRALDLFDADGRPHLVRTLVDGPTLVERHGDRPATRGEARLLADSFGATLAHLHERGFLLVDHKPSNLHLEARGAVLLDVGNAERAPAGVDAGVQLSGVRGTRSFLPPEMVARRTVDARSDVWGLGRMIAFALTGRLFRGNEPTLAEVIAGLDGDARGLVERLCAPDPSDRPRTAIEARELAQKAL